MIYINTKRQNNLDGLIVTAAVIAKIIGVSERQVRNLAEDKMIPKLKNGSYELIPTLNAYIENLKLSQKAEKTEIRKTATFQEEKTMHERAKRVKAELILGEMKGELHRSEDVEKVMTDMLTNFRSKLLAFPNKVAPILIGRSEIPVIQDILENQIYEALDELKEYDAELFRSDVYIEEADEDDS